MVSFGACSSDSDNDKAGKGKGTTYLSIVIGFPKEGQGELRAGNSDYNPAGTFFGRTWLNTIDLYILSADGSTLLGSQRYSATDIVYTLDAQGNAIVEPKDPFLTNSGDKIVYVIINSPQPLLAAAPTATDYLSIAGGSPTLADLASVQGGLDLVMMTGQSGVTGIAGGVTADDVKAGKNRVKINATRIASRAIVTTTAPANVVDKNGILLGTISAITYSVAQGGNAVYYTPDTLTYKTWGYDYLPGADYAATALQYYDYNDLLNTTDVVPANPSTPSDPRAFLNLNGKFLLENTHKYGTDGGNYRKGNTAYVLVRGTFVPDPTAIIDGGTLTSGTFYVGETDGKIYSSIAAAQNPGGGGANPQDVKTYQNGKVLYYVWLNPDVITHPLNSPVIRNNIYHININSFKTIGFNWNPLVPTGATNPDPKPTIGGIEPNSPILPVDPLSLDETYMSVDITVLSWSVHSFGVDL
jgi:hypothetical protein